MHANKCAHRLAGGKCYFPPHRQSNLAELFRVSETAQGKGDQNDGHLNSVCVSDAQSRSQAVLLPHHQSGRLLTYIIPLTRGCSPWRPAADMSTDSQGNDRLPLIFKDCYRHTRHLRDGRCSSNHLTLSPDNLIQGSSRKKKRNQKKRNTPPKGKRERERQEAEKKKKKKKKKKKNQRTKNEGTYERERERKGGREGRSLSLSLSLCLSVCFLLRSLAPRRRRVSFSFFLSLFLSFFLRRPSFLSSLLFGGGFFLGFFSFELRMIVKKKRELFLGSVPTCQGSIVLPQHILRLVQEY